MTAHKIKNNRDGVSTLSQVSAFLGGLFFTALLVLFEQNSRFQAVVFETSFQNMNLQITQKQIIAIPLTTSIILFLFSAFFFGIACSEPSEVQFDKLAQNASAPFMAGFISFFVSLSIVLILIDILTGVIGILLAIGLTVWWLRKVPIYNSIDEPSQ